MDITDKSRKLAFLLRHDKDYIFDGHGYREVKDLIENHGFTKSLLETIVHDNNKQRFEFNEDKTKIRARQGHSVKVNVDLQTALPPEVLYHGTAKHFLESIRRDGLKPGNRLHVHLSKDIPTALNVGKRHGEPVVLTIDTKTMLEDGFVFYLSNNGVWLVDSVPIKYISTQS